MSRLNFMAPGLVGRLLLTCCLALAMAGVALPARADPSLLFCSKPSTPTVEVRSRLLLFSNALRQMLDNSSRRAVIISRSGLDLDRFDIRLSHAGISLRDNPDAAWSVRQLYFSCDENRPHIYDQGLPGFLLDQGDGNRVYVSMVFLPPDAEEAMIRAAADNKLAVALQAGEYSANAYPFSTRYQNCNQWLMEMLAQAWGHLPLSGDLREQAQVWLRESGYQPSMVDVKHQYMVWAVHFVPLVHNDDQPADNLDEHRYQVSLPDSIEHFVRQRVPGSRRVQMCLHGSQLVTHRGWDDIPDGCIARDGDTVVELEPDAVGVSTGAAR
jgi:hypothetical protein